MQVQLGNITQVEAAQALREMGLPPAFGKRPTAPEAPNSNTQMNPSVVDTAPAPQEKPRRRIGTNIGSSAEKATKAPPKPIPRPRPGRPPSKKPPPLPSKRPPIHSRQNRSPTQNSDLDKSDIDQDSSSHSYENENDEKMGASLEIADSDDGSSDSELVEYNEEDELIADLVATSKRYVVEQRRRRSSVRAGFGSSGRSPAASSALVDSDSVALLPHMALPGSPSPAVVNRLRRNASLSPNTARLAAAAAAAAAAVDQVGVDRHGQGGESINASIVHGDQTNLGKLPTTQDQQVPFNLATQLRRYYNEQLKHYLRAIGKEPNSLEAKSASPGFAVACTRVVQPPSADSYLNNWTSRATANAVVGSHLSLSSEILFETTCAHYLQMVNYEYVLE